MENFVSETISENTESKKYYLLVETTEEGIKQFKAAPESLKQGITISSMRVEGVMVPALKYEVDKETYLSYKREEWKQEDRFKQENRCIICGTNGKSRRCPIRIPNPNYTGAPGETKTLAVDCDNCPYGYDRLFKPIKGKVLFSTLNVIDSDGNSDPYEPVSPDGYHSGDNYYKLLSGLIDYINTNYPKYAQYTELLALLGNELDMKEAVAIMDKPKSTLYDFLKKARAFYEEYRDTVDFM